MRRCGLWPEQRCYHVVVVVVFLAGNEVSDGEKIIPRFRSIRRGTAAYVFPTRSRVFLDRVQRDVLIYRIRETRSNTAGRSSRIVFHRHGQWPSGGTVPMYLRISCTGYISTIVTKYIYKMVFVFSDASPIF